MYAWILNALLNIINEYIMKYIKKSNLRRLSVWYHAYKTQKQWKLNCVLFRAKSIK